ncbi:hypothetical protein GBAR_LOCUS27662, partial [Geodia barretti]
MAGAAKGEGEEQRCKGDRERSTDATAQFGGGTADKESETAGAGVVLGRGLHLPPILTESPGPPLTLYQGIRRHRGNWLLSRSRV